MSDTRRTWAQLAVLFADNTAGAISAQDLRDFLESVTPHVTASAPGVGDDDADGFDQDSAWIDTSTTPGSLYRCLDASTGAAVWVKVYPATASVAWGGITGTLADQTDLQTALDLKANVATVSVNAQTGTTYTLVIDDAGKLLTLENAEAITLTIPTNATVAFPIGTTIAGAQLGAGAVTIQGATGVTVNGVSAGSEATSAQYATFAAVKLATDAWLVSGGLA